MVVTMQETFAGIRVVKSFAREEHQEKLFRRSNRLQFQNMMRIIRAMEAIRPDRGSHRRVWYWLGPPLHLFRQPESGRFIALNLGIALLYEPIKTLSKMHVIMQQSIQATTEVFAIMDSASTVQDCPAQEFPALRGLIEFEHVTFRYAGGVRCGDRPESADRAWKNLRARRCERRGEEHDSIPDPTAL